MGYTGTLEVNDIILEYILWNKSEAVYHLRHQYCLDESLYHWDGWGMVSSHKAGDEA
jgi:hypothetical protein